MEEDECKNGEEKKREEYSDVYTREKELTKRQKMMKRVGKKREPSYIYIYGAC